VFFSRLDLNSCLSDFISFRIEAFGCHNVEGRFYLRADYRVTCYDDNWWLAASYAILWVVLFVLGFPLFVLQQLVRNHKHAKDGDSFFLAFLFSDYRTDDSLVVACWEAEEMLRKLVMSCVGSFWVEKSPMAIATALLLSLVALFLHTHFRPYNSSSSNALQAYCLMVLSTLYFCGLLLKAEAVEVNSSAGPFLIAIVASLLLGFVTLVVMEFRLGRAHLRQVLHSFQISYEGKVHSKKGIPCVASFPGKYESQWNQITELGENEMAERSIACVFLPKHTPRFGTHEVDGERKDGRCYCHTIYGETKVHAIVHSVFSSDLYLASSCVLVHTGLGLWVVG
jgi:hypothetical protein